MEPRLESPQAGMKEKMGLNIMPRKGIIRMITGGPVGADSHHARKAEIKKAHSEMITEVLDVEAEEDTPIIQYTLWRSLRSNAVRGYPLEEVNTSLYGFAGEVVHPRGLISLPLTLGTCPAQRKCVLKFLVVDVPSAYNVILGRPTLNMFQAVISMYHMKIKFPTPGGVGEVKGDPLQSRMYYVEAVRKGQKRSPNEALKGPPQGKRSREGDLEEDLDAGQGTPLKVQPAEELLNIELVPGDSEKITRIGSQIDEILREEVIKCLKRNMDVFAWTP
ncbi:UNVERIFIED_CONTAM: hypothetical protein Slati_1489700 [Sesamum latifolium]|uniref:Gag-pol polyprotein n=1 Tax=Sesamum latifolium TaxID=2727402 RepID=A0AAW2X6F3_9LAMI